MSRALVPAESLAPLLRAWLVAGEGRTRRLLAERSRVPERRIYAILAGEQRFVQFGTADRLLCGIEAVEEWHLSLADLYERSAAEPAPAARAAVRPRGRGETALDRLRAVRLAAIAAGRLPRDAEEKARAA